MVYTHFISDYNYVINENEYIILPSKKYIGVVVYIWIIRWWTEQIFEVSSIISVSIAHWGNFQNA